MIDYEKKGFFNIYILVNKDNVNIFNSDNKYIYF